MREWKDIADDYGRYLTHERAMSANSVASYLFDLQIFGEWLGEHCATTPEKAERGHVEQFMASLHECGKTASSQARTLSGLRSFFNYLVYTGLSQAAATDFVEMPRMRRHLPETLSLEEIDRTLATIDLSQPAGHRDRAMLEMLYSCGLRVSELMGLRLTDLFFDEGVVRVTGKGDKQRLVPLSDEARTRLEQYLAQRVHIEPKPAGRQIVFLNRFGGPLSRMAVFNVMKKAVGAAGITRNVSPHTMRHSFATHLLEGGANIRQIQELLGHESILTTEIYTHLDRTHLRSSLENHHPLAALTDEG